MVGHAPGTETMEQQAQRLDRPGGHNGQGDTYQPGVTIWPLVAVLGAAIGVPGLVHGLPSALQATLIATGVLVGVVAVIGWFRDDLLAPVHAARRRLMTTPVDPPAPYVSLTAAVRSESEAALHLRTLQEVARLRFNFPTHEFRDYVTYSNHPQETMGVQMPGGSVAYPDIVVVQSPENFTKIVAQVETAETVNEDVAFYEWGPYAELAPLYLYVPTDKGNEALALCRKLDVAVVGIRTWRYIAGDDEIEVEDHFDV